MSLLKIGLTGGIASGKSLASRFFSELGIDVIDADQIAKSLFSASSTHLNTLRSHFGDSIFDQNDELNRKALGEIVFNQPRQLKWLNDFTHPLINQQMKQQISRVTSPYVILDIPLLIDKSGTVPRHLKSLIDKIVIVDCDVATQIERIGLRDNSSTQAAIKIIESQSSREQKQKYADYIVTNNGSIEELKHQIGKLNDELMKMV